LFSRAFCVFIAGTCLADTSSHVKLLFQTSAMPCD
jgi:hypothetical protein